ncbi:MAG: molecular chaperone TorD family protein [Burkholderiaceae bacterium]
MLDEQQDTSAISAQEIPVAGPITNEQRLRAGAYSLLGSLLSEAPDKNLLEHLGQHNATEVVVDDTAAALQALADASLMAKANAVREEFQDLFIGMGRGELVPYGSWYLTGFLMEKPLGVLRTDLDQLGFERQQNVTEPEDHVAALCEVMSLLILDGTKHSVQQEFFNKHIATWFPKFFSDLQKAKSATNFYRAVGQFGRAFTELEIQYFSMQV